MDDDLEFRIGDPSVCESIVRRNDDLCLGPSIDFYLACYPLGSGVGPCTFPLGQFLSTLGLTVADCAAALEAERRHGG